ncbi:MAG: hypothetical protein JOY96_08575 [Verrucomicrobia bacterium]|nr:hypothetical protein [Verrucomicrobiota bacterium]
MGFVDGLANTTGFQNRLTFQTQELIIPGVVSQPQVKAALVVERLWRTEISLGTGLFLVGIVQFFRVDQIPGDLGDSRFNMYVLEHGYRWLMHLDGSFWSAPFFYPAPDVITYSDNHLGSFLFYSVFRIFGAGRETAFQLWAVTIFSLNYFITWIVLWRHRCNAVGAAGAAYVFTFGLAMAAQMTHIQLAPRFMVPIAFWMSSRLIETGLPKYLHGLLAACAYQIYLGIYVGYFLILSLVPFCLALFLIQQRWTRIGSFIKQSDCKISYRLIEYTVSCLVFVLVLLPIAIPYYRTHQWVGNRSWEEVMKMLPRTRSYFYGPDSILWGKISQQIGAELPFCNEHKLFPGVLPYLAIIAFVYLRLKNKTDRALSQAGLAMIGVLLVLVLLTSYRYRFALYHSIWTFFPGAGAIRGVSRIALVLLYPVVFIFAVTGTAIMQGHVQIGARWKQGFLGLGLLLLTVVDQAAVSLSVSKRECKRRITQMETAMLQARGSRVDRNVFWVNQNNGDPYYVKDLDVMLAGQALGMNVVNGYSGLVPKGYAFRLTALEGDWCDDLRNWAKINPGFITDDSLIQIGSRCQLSSPKLSR